MSEQKYYCHYDNVATRGLCDGDGDCESCGVYREWKKLEAKR